MGANCAERSLDVIFLNLHHHTRREASISLFFRQGYLDSEKQSHLLLVAERAGARLWAWVT